MKKRVGSMAVLLVVLVSLAAGCGSKVSNPPEQTKPQPQSAPGGPKQLVVALVAEPDALDVHQLKSASDRQAVLPIYEGLLEQSTWPHSYDLKPGLAETWSVSADGLVYTFHLRKGVKFHDGTPFDAEAVKFNWDRLLDTNNEWKKLAKIAYAPRLGEPLKSYRVVDEFTFEATLKSRDATWLHYIAQADGKVISPTAVRKYGAEIGQHGVGTGSFRVASREKGQSLILERNPDYWGTKPLLEKVIMVSYPSAPVRMAALQSGQVDVALDLPSDAIAQVKKDPNLALAQVDISSHLWYLVFNFNGFEPFKKLAVRQAFDVGVDRKGITEGLYGGTAVPAATILAPVYQSVRNPSLTPVAHDPAKAKQLLAQAGYPTGFEVEFLVPESGPGMRDPVGLSTLIQAQLEEVGIKTKLTVLEWGAYQERFDKGQFQLAQRTWSSGYGTPDNPLTNILHSSRKPPNRWNAGSWVNDRFDMIVAQARGELDEKKAKELYFEAQGIVATELPIIVLHHDTATYGVRARVKNFFVHPSANLYFDKVDVN